MLSLVGEDSHGTLTPRCSIGAEPNKSKVPISCKLSPAVAGVEERTGWGVDRVQRREGAGWWWEHRKGLGGIEGIMPECWMWDQVMFGQGLRKYHMRHLHARRLYQGSSLRRHSELSGRDDGTQTQVSASKRHKQTFALVGRRDWHWFPEVWHRFYSQMRHMPHSTQFCSVQDQQSHDICSSKCPILVWIHCLLSQRPQRMCR